MWTHTVIEIYKLNDCWPTEGEPADWIEQDLVSWCQGHDDTVIYFMPFYKILWIKLCKWADTIYCWFFNNIYANELFPWGRAWHKRMDEEWRDLFSENE